eukprot:CAMPEP_0174831336 /NCGR_PEP_ID=MMETSP1114-20130205/3034_1 /TAXON_ID=312471 /ORGANISM="Neobodo designis, Strain CCAP 1951/1" /LENGTH=302 /DNA_ID=CAMNT_0016065157 /DNA_START=36 /DNA_END=944 /DNA_ORIENTATION=-
MSLLVNACIVVTGVTAAMWAACRFRLLPKKVMRGWFIAVLICNVLVMAIVSFFFDKLRLLGVPYWFTKILNTYVCRITFGAVVRFNPHVRIHMDDESWKTWSEVPRRSCVVLNHTSFWDAFLFVGISPWQYIYNAKTLMKDSLKKLPVFGSIFDRVGHFPVYFKSDEDGNFSVDKERQAPVAEAVKKHLEEGGRICLFPEGAVNKKPRKLLPFRRGTFGTIMEHRLPVYYFVTAGNEDTWPYSAAVGGLPADIVISVKKFDIDFDKEEPLAVAARLEAAMQQSLDTNYARRDALVGGTKKQS